MTSEYPQPYWNDATMHDIPVPVSMYEGISSRHSSDAGEHSEGSCLASSIHPEQAKTLARGHSKGQAIYSCISLEPLA